MGLKVKGYVLGAIAAATYGMNPLFALPLYSAGMTVDSVLFFRYLCAIPILGLMIKLRGRSFAVSSKQFGALVIFGFMMALSSLMLFMSYKYMDAGIASTILFVYPVMVALIMATVFHEKASTLLICCMALSISGIGMMYKSPESSSGASFSITGMVLVIISALTYAIYIVWVNKSSVKSLPTLVISFYVLLFGVILFAIRLCINGSIEYPSSDQWHLWLCILASAVFPTVISFVCTTSAIQYVGSTATAILGSLEPVTAVVIGVSVFDEVLTPADLIGIIMILTAVIMVVGGSSLPAAIMRIRRMFPRLPHKSV